ncbi:HDOD domain-containing protein [Desulfomarina sp.]
MNTADNNPVLQTLNRAQLPVLPSSVSTLLTAFEDEALDYSRIAEILQNFPTIVIRLISLANSAWSAPIRKITELDEACARLGFGVVKSISISLAVSAPFDPGRCPPFDVHKYWVRAMAVAETTFNLTVARPGKDLLKSARTAGILHNLGLLWMAHQLPQATALALRLHQSDQNISINQTLKEQTGAGYREAGGYLGKLWCLPDPLPQTMEFHENKDYRNKGWEMSLLVGVAVSMVTATELNLKWSPPFDPLEILGIKPVDAEKIFDYLWEQLERIHQSATILIGH